MDECVHGFPCNTLLDEKKAILSIAAEDWSNMERA